MDVKKISDNIKKFRELKGITREALAGDLDMSVSGFSKIERGEIDLTLSRLNKIANLLEVSIPQILNFDATNIFNVTNNKQVGLETDYCTINNFENKHSEKYITFLEQEIERLKGL